jgi:transcriptional regulator with XRE-family HTH domain
VNNPTPAKAAAAEAGLTGRAVAGVYGCGISYVSLVLNGKLEPSPRFKAFFAELVGKPADDLFPEPVDPVAPLLAQRIEQGFAETVTDPAVLRRVAAILADAADAIERRPA